MRTTRSRTLAALAAGALLLGPLAACGSDNSSKNVDAKTASSASASPSESASASAGESSSASTAGAAAPGEALTKDNLVPTMLAAMKDKKSAHMVMEIGSSVGAQADIRYAGNRTDMKMSMDMGPTKATVILVNGVMYMQQGAGGKYLKIDRSDPAMGNLLDQMSSFGPESSVSAMQGAIQEVQKTGTDTIDGTKVDKYHVVVDSSSLAKTLGGASAGTADLPKTVAYDLYVDQDHLMRRIDMTVNKQHIVMTVSKWGEPVDITAPPASQVMTR
jgi:hypothetical protein